MGPCWAWFQFLYILVVYQCISDVYSPLFCFPRPFCRLQRLCPQHLKVSWLDNSKFFLHDPITERQGEDIEFVRTQSWIFTCINKWKGTLVVPTTVYKRNEAIWYFKTIIQRINAQKIVSRKQKKIRSRLVKVLWAGFGGGGGFLSGGVIFFLKQIYLNGLEPFCQIIFNQISICSYYIWMNCNLKYFFSIYIQSIQI